MLTPDELRGARQRAQLLSGEQPGDVIEAVARLGAVQAQLGTAAQLALRARTTATTATDVERAREDRSLVCTWTLRGTLHLVAAADVRWMVDLLGPVNAAGGRRRRESLGLDPATCERGVEAITEVVRGSPPLPRAELIRRVAEHGVRVDPKTQAPAHLVGYAANAGAICRGPDLDGEATYVLLDEWVPHRGRLDGGRLDRDDALAELARRYLAAHAPAVVTDFAAWSGLPVADARRAFELIGSELSTVETDAGPLLAPSTSTGAGTPPPPRLLGHFDPLLLGYRSKDLLLDPSRAKVIQAGGGFLRPAVLVDGRVAGTWRLDRSRKASTVLVEPFDRLSPDVADMLEAEAGDIARFLGADVRLRIDHA